MSRKIKVGYIDKTIWSAESRQMVGDMGYAFCDMRDTRVLEKDIDESIRANCIEFVNSDEAKEWEDVGDGKETDFTIYELRKVNLIVDEDDEEEKDADLPLWAYDVDEDEEGELVEVYVCATEEDAKTIVENYYGKDVKAYYRDEE